MVSGWGKIEATFLCFKFTFLLELHTHISDDFSKSTQTVQKSFEKKIFPTHVCQMNKHVIFRNNKCLATITNWKPSLNKLRIMEEDNLLLRLQASIHVHGNNSFFEILRVLIILADRLNMIALLVSLHNL